MDKYTDGLIRTYFGETAEIKRKWFGGFRITTSAGDQVDYDYDDGFTDLIGGPELYRAMLLMTQEIKGHVSVSGSREHIIATQAHGAAMGITVIPEIREGQGCLMFLTAVAFFMFGSIFGILVWAIWFRPWYKTWLTRKARRDGQQYRNVFPEIHGSERVANRDAARDRGLL